MTDQTGAISHVDRKGSSDPSSYEVELHLKNLEFMICSQHQFINSQFRILNQFEYDGNVLKIYIHPNPLLEFLFQFRI